MIITYNNTDVNLIRGHKTILNFVYLFINQLTTALLTYKKTDFQKFSIQALSKNDHTDKRKF